MFKPGDLALLTFPYQGKIYRWIIEIKGPEIAANVNPGQAAHYPCSPFTCNEGRRLTEAGSNYLRPFSGSRFEKALYGFEV